MTVVVVESPSKAKTINKYLGKDFEVFASFGHIRDLPAKDGSVDPDNDFEMSWLVESDSNPALQPEEAFVYEAIGLSAETALVRFTVEPGYYLYRDKFEFRVLSPEGFEVREVTLPEGIIKDDP